MKKNFKYYAGIWTVALILFNGLVFTIPGLFSGFDCFDFMFWFSYSVITITFIGQLLVSFFVFNNKDSQKFFYGIPLIQTTWTGLILTLLFGAACMSIPAIPEWIGMIACLVIVSFNATALIKATAAADIVGGIDDKIKEKTHFIKSLSADAQGLVSRAKDEKARFLTKKVYEAVRFSDPMSGEALADLERSIAFSFERFSNAVISGQDNIENIADELLVLIADRNRKCKLLK